jgi:hypothetical protein
VVTGGVLAEKRPFQPPGVVMEPTNIRQRFGKTSPGAAAAPGLKIAGVYQDLKSRAWAEDLWNRVAQLTGPDAVQVAAWTIDELNHAPAFQEAVSAATLADVLVVSIHAGEQLPPGLCAWIDAWLPRRQRRDGALIVLLGVTAGQPDVPLARAKEYLRTIACRGGLDFLLREHIGALHRLKTSIRSEPSVPGANPIRRPEREKS